MLGCEDYVKLVAQDCALPKLLFSRDGSENPAITRTDESRRRFVKLSSLEGDGVGLKGCGANAATVCTYMPFAPEPLDPSEDCCMREIDSSLGHHLDEVAVAQLVGDIPSDAENDDGTIEVAATEERG